MNKKPILIGVLLSIILGFSYPVLAQNILKQADAQWQFKTFSSRFKDTIQFPGQRHTGILYGKWYRKNGQTKIEYSSRSSFQILIKNKKNYWLTAANEWLQITDLPACGPEDLLLYDTYFDLKSHQTNQHIVITGTQKPLVQDPEIADTVTVIVEPNSNLVQKIVWHFDQRPELNQEIIYRYTTIIDRPVILQKILTISDFVRTTDYYRFELDKPIPDQRFKTPSRKSPKTLKRKGEPFE